MRKMWSLVVIFGLLLTALVAAVSLEDNLRIDEVEIDDQEAAVYTQEEVDNVSSIDDLDGVVVEEGAEVEFEVVVAATSTQEDVQVEVEIRGYEYSDYEDLDDRTELFDMDVGGTGESTRRKHLSITLPQQLEKDRYFLRVTVDDKDSAAIVRYVVLQIEPARHDLTIADVAFSPGNSVTAGRSLLASVLLANNGDKDEDDVKVTVEIPQLGVQATEFVDVVATDDNNVDYEDVPEMFLPIPATAAAGEYQVVVTATYDNFEQVSETYTLRVVADERFAQGSDTLVLAVGPEVQNIAAGQTATYAVALTNAGVGSQAYVLQAMAGDWATASLSSSLVVLTPGGNDVVYVQVTPDSNTVAGEHLVSLVISSGDEVLETVQLRANVVPGVADTFSLRNGLEIALIVLVVLLVIIGLIVGFSRLRRDEDEEQTYY
jgi:uncharacterized membrane protein